MTNATAKKKPKSKPLEASAIVPASLPAPLTGQGVCRALGICDWTLCQFLSSGYFPAADCRVGDSLRWSISLVTRWREDLPSRGVGVGRRVPPVPGKSGSGANS